MERVARRIGLDDPSKIRLTSHNCYSQQPKPQPIKYRELEHLSDMLVHYNQVWCLSCGLSSWNVLLLLLVGVNYSCFSIWQTSDILYYEVLDIPLPELQGLKNLKVAFHHATKDEVRLKSITIATSLYMCVCLWIMLIYLILLVILFKLFSGGNTQHQIA